MRRVLAVTLILVGAVAAHAAPAGPVETLRDATDVLADLQKIPNKGIPASLIANAQAVVIIPRVIKAGFVVGGRAGHGVVLTRGEGGGWGDPNFVHIGGASVGLQVGVQATDLVLVFRNRKSLDRILDGKGKLTLGADAGVAAGPVGRQAEAGTDGRLRAEILSYSRSRGLFAGVSLEGAILAAEPDMTRAFRNNTGPEAIKAVEALATKLAEISVEAPIGGDRPPPPSPSTPPTAVPDSPPSAVPSRP